MEEQFQHIIFKFLSGEASKPELLKLSEWLKESAEHKKMFDKTNELWHLNEKKLRNVDLNIDSAWQKLSSKVKKNNNRSTYKPILISSNKFTIYRAAAVALILISLSLTLFWISDNFNNSKVKFVTIFAPLGEKSKVQLADGTIVWLNSGSSLKYAADFNRTNRTAVLEGEAYFDVTHDKSNPFFVKTKDVKIKVWGTSFNVRAYNNDNIVETTLEHGSISMQLPNQKKDVFIKPGQQLLFSKSSSSVQLKKVDVDVFTSWKQNILKFDNADFNEIIKKLERWYGVHILLDSKMKHSERYTMTIKTESLREVLKRIKITTPISYKIEVDSVFIYSIN